MDTVVCPHCNEHRIATVSIPKDVIAVMPCPACHELALLFRNKVFPLSRRIIEYGNRKERSSHFAEVIAEFLESGIFPIRGLGIFQQDAAGGEKARTRPSDGGKHLKISQREFDKFVNADLRCIDDADYFKKHFN